jgi:hypothetical protein
MQNETLSPEEVDEIHNELAALVERYLPDTAFAFTSGSLPYGAAVRGRSDIDINIVLPAGTDPDTALFGRINSFIDDYSSLHARHGMVMDKRFPGEYFTAEQASNAAQGRGVPVDERGPRLPHQPDDTYWTTTAETWYLAWLGALAFSRYVIGDATALAGLRRRAWTTILALCMPDLLPGDFLLEDALARVLAHDHPHGGFGVHWGYTRFVELETLTCKQAIVDLAEMGVVKVLPNSRFRVLDDGYAEWLRTLRARRATSFCAPDLLTVGSSRRLAR